MNKGQIELAKRRAWADTRTAGEKLTDEEVLDWASPSDNFNEGFDAGMAFALSHQWVRVEERLPEDDRYFYLIADTRLDPLGIDCVEYTCETKLFSRNGKIVHPTHWCTIPQLNP